MNQEQQLRQLKQEHQALENALAIQRVRELANKFDSSSHYTGHFITDAIFKALDGEQR